MKILLISIFSLASFSVFSQECDVLVSHYYLEANIEVYPAVFSKEVSFEESKQLDKQKNSYFVALKCRNTREVRGVMKIKEGSPFYWFEYVFDEGVISGTKLIYANGKPTVYAHALKI